MLKLNKRGQILKKILIYGLPGHGKSTFAKDYSVKNNLKPIVIDIDDTNFTGLDIAYIDSSNDLKLYNSIKNVIKEVNNTDYDTIIIDGLGSLLEGLISKAKGQRKFLDRSDRFNSIFNDLVKSKKNLIFIGQNDCNLEDYTESLPNKSILKVNSIVNEIYYCVRDGENFIQNVDKFRKEIANNNNNNNKIKVKETIIEKEEGMTDTTHEMHLKNIINEIEEKKGKNGLPIFKATLERIRKRVAGSDFDKEMKEKIIKQAEAEYEAK